MGRRTGNLGEDKTHTLAILPSTHVTLTRAYQGKRVVRSSLLQKEDKRAFCVSVIGLIVAKRKRVESVTWKTLGVSRSMVVKWNLQDEGSRWD